MAWKACRWAPFRGCRAAQAWSGVGPANFAMPYLRHKLPQASEEIQDPHNMILEVWATAGIFARPGSSACSTRPPCMSTAEFTKALSIVI